MTMDMQDYVKRSAAEGELVVQPRMGMSPPEDMAAGLHAVAGARARVVGTVTIDSYTRVGDHAGARRAVEAGQLLNGFPIVVHGPAVTSAMLRMAADGFGGTLRMPVQVRHGSAVPRAILRAAIMSGLTASEGGPVSYCLPYGRTPLAKSVHNWDVASTEFAEIARMRGARALLETFGGCMLGQLCPPSMLVALSVLEAMYFAQRGLTSVALSYAQQTHPVQDVEALAALRLLAGEMLPAGVDWHIVLYTYMGVYPRTPAGAGMLLDGSAELAVRGGAERLIVKTVAEAVRIPTVAENVIALERASRIATAAKYTAASGAGCDLPWASEVDCSEVYDEARAMITAVADGGDIGKALVRAFAAGILDVPFCLHRDNLGLTQTRIAEDGRLRWAHTGRLPLPSGSRTEQPVRSQHLLSMLRFTADGFDRSAVEARRRAPVEGVYRIGVVGSGPRGIAVLERLAARLAADPPSRPLEIHLFDAVEVGAGRIWRTDQQPWYLMNTVAGEVTMFSGEPDGGPARPGSGPTLAQWWASTDPDCPGPNGYAPRPLYGRYLRFVLDTVEHSLPAGVTLHRRRAEVVDLQQQRDGYLLTTAGGDSQRLDRVLLATGHPRPRLDAGQQLLADFAREQRNLVYVRGDSASDMPLGKIKAGMAAGILGLGLSFYDIMVALTIGRGGRFVTDEHGELIYIPSGEEPLLVAGSRSGVPIPARGINQKPSVYTYRPRLFTADRVARLPAPRDFRRDVLPLLLNEMRLVYYATAIRQKFGEDVADRFTAQAVALDGFDLPELAVHFGVDLPPLDIERLSRPFADRVFASRTEFDAALIGLIDDDLAHASMGNSDGPLKAACDVLRDTRGVLRKAVDFSGLEPDSHRHDFLTWFTPLQSFLAAGPPLLRLKQTKALIRSGALRVLGPSVRFECDPRLGRFVASSPQVRGAVVTLDALIDGRIPTPSLGRDLAPLSRRLRRTGVWTSYHNGSFDTGGVAVTPAPFHPIGADGTADTGLYVLGIPTEHTRWFTQVGSGRPGAWAEFVRDADAIAAHMLTGVRAVQKVGELR